MMEIINRKLLVLSVLMILILVSGSVTANLITNGSFEQPGGTAGNSVNCELGSCNYAGSNWGDTVVPDNWAKTGTRLYYVTDEGANQFPDGDYAVRIDANSGAEGVNVFSQSGLNLLAGVTYELSFYVWAETTAARIDVALSGASAISILDDFAIDGTDGVAELATIQVTPTVTGIYTIEFFIDPGNDDNHAWLDGLSLVQTQIVGELYIEGPWPTAVNQIELDNDDTGADITDTQVAGNLRNLYYDGDNSGFIEAAEQLGSGNDVATFTYSILNIQVGDTLQWLADGDDPAFVAIAAGTNVGSLDVFTLKVDGIDYTVSGLTTVNPVTVGGFLVSLNVYDTGNDTVDNVAYGASGASDIAVQLSFDEANSPPSVGCDTIIPGDWNGDCIVDLNDLLIMLEMWLSY
jgi:hypothetical protein